jgi:hypothetical protein
MTLKTLVTAAMATLVVASLTASAHALNPQPLPPKESRFSLITRHPINVLNRHVLQSNTLARSVPVR